MQNIKKLMLLLCFGVTLPVSSAQITQVMRPGWLRYEIDSIFDGLDLESNTDGLKLNLGQNRLRIPVRLAYGLSEGIEVLGELPFTWYERSDVSGSSALLTGPASSYRGKGLGDMSLGIKVKLLEDTGRTPAFLLEAKIKLPTGSSSVARYARVLSGESVDRGTGTGTFDLAVATTVSAYMHPLEGFLKLELMSRGADDEWAAGANQHVDYGGRTRATAGLEMDFNNRIILALDSSTTIYAADRWTVNGDNVLTGLGNSVSAFRASALGQGGIHLAGSTEWYMGPRVEIRIVDAVSVSLHGEIGLSPDSSTWRGGLSLHGYFKPGFGLGSLFSRKQTVSPSTTSPVIVEAVAPRESRRDVVLGNLQRYIYTRYQAADKARKAGDWVALAGEVKVLEDLDPTPTDLKPQISVMREKLFLLASENYKAGDKAALKKDWLEAVRGWRKALQYRPGFEPAQKALKRNHSNIQKASRKIYLQGIDLYVNHQDPKGALNLWERSMELTPGDEKTAESISKARKKIKAIRDFKERKN